MRIYQPFFVVVIFLLIVTTSQAQKVSKYQPDSAVVYAFKYWGKLKLAHLDSIYFPRYPDGNNCCNFISQCLLAGLSGKTEMKEVKAQTANFQAKPFWYYNDYNDRGRAWSVVHDLWIYATSNPPKGLAFQHIVHDFTSKSRPNIFMDVTGIKVGDVVFMDYENDGNYDHVMIVTMVTNKGVYYNDIRLTGHTDHWRNQSLLAIKMKYKYKVVFQVFRPLSFN